MHPNDYIKVIMLLCFLQVILHSCDCKYDIKADYIFSSCKFNQGFYFEEIKVDSFDISGKPICYKTIKSLDLIKTKGSVSQKKIYFKKPNEGYKWLDTKNNKIYDTLPIIIKNDKFYNIRGLIFRGHPDRAIFFYLCSDSLKVFGYSESKNW